MQAFTKEKNMSKAKKVHQIFAIFNANIPIYYENHMQLLQRASSLVDLFEEPLNEPNFDLRIDGGPFDKLATDAIINNHSWRIVSEEKNAIEDFEMEDEYNASIYREAKYLIENIK